jgi:hypothetical protein
LTFYPIRRFFHSTFCPIQRFFHSMFFPFNVSYSSTFCPSQHFFNSTFCPIRRFVFRCFVLRRFENLCKLGLKCLMFSNIEHCLGLSDL